MTPQQVLTSYPPHDYTVPSLLATRRKIVGRRDALQFKQRRWTYDELVEGAEALASLLVQEGVVKGDRVAHIAPNSDLAVLFFLAVARIGAVFVPMNVELSDKDLGYMLEHSGARLTIARTEDVERIEGIRQAKGMSFRLLQLDDLGEGCLTAQNVVRTWRTISSDKALSVDVLCGPDDPALIIYTSGTTGFPKGVVHSHRTYILAGEVFVSRMNLQRDDRLLSVFPLFHGNAILYSIGGAFAAGAASITTAKFSASKFWDLAVATGATQLNILAALGSILMLRPRSEYRPEHQIRKIYGGPISAEMFKVFQGEFNVPVLIEGYGMSEIPAVCSNPFEGPYKVGSIGVSMRHPTDDRLHAELQVQDDDGQALPVGSIGELAVRTPTLFAGYLNDEEQTRAAFREGWFLTGDLVRMDAEGYVFFVSRKKDIIRRRGENISGAELDQVIGSHPDVAEAAAIAVPAELGEDEILVAVVLKEGRQLGYAQLHEWCRGQLAPIKVPRYLLFVGALPHTPSHRVAKQILKQDTSLRANAFDAEAARGASH